jgi:hypothetical protein
MRARVLKSVLVFMALAVLAIPESLRAQELRDADDVLWLLDRDRRNLSAEYQRILAALEASKVPTADRARDIAVRFKLAHGGIRAEEGPKVVGLLRIGRDLPPFASRGDLVWVVRIAHSWLGVTQEMWIGSASGEVRAMLPVDER